MSRIHSHHAGSEPATVLEHVAWVRRLAARLVNDTWSADDVAQETLAIALTAMPGETKRQRSWLSTVARRVASRFRRTEDRRELRERAAVCGEAAPATDDVVERATLQRCVVDHVLALPEPYRTTILLRFLEELPTGVIAERRGEPVETVRTRLKRGLALLRDRVPRELAIAVASGASSLGSGSVAATTAGTGVLLMSLKAKLTFVAAAIVAGAFALQSLRSDPADADEAAESSADRPATPIAADATERQRAIVTGSRSVTTIDPDRPAPAPASEPTRPRWLEELGVELTKESLADSGVREDTGVELRTAVHGLQAESLDFDGLLTYIDSRLEDSWSIPGTFDSGPWIAPGGSDRDRKDEWLEAYANSSGGVSLARMSVVSDSFGYTVRIGFDVPSWAEASGIEQVETAALFLQICHLRDGTVRGQVNLSGRIIALDGRSEAESRQELCDRHAWDSWAIADVANGSGRLWWLKTGAGVPLSVPAIEFLGRLHARCSERARDLRAVLAAE